MSLPGVTLAHPGVRRQLNPYSPADHSGWTSQRADKLNGSFSSMAQTPVPANVNGRYALTNLNDNMNRSHFGMNTT